MVHAEKDDTMATKLMSDMMRELAGSVVTVVEDGKSYTGKMFHWGNDEYRVDYADHTFIAFPVSEIWKISYREARKPIITLLPEVQR